MDEELDSDDKSVNSVLAQEFTELLAILSRQSKEVIMKLFQMMPGDAGWNIIQPASSSAELTKHIKTMLEYFMLANAADCRKFLEAMCMLCEDIPMHLESKLMSVAGCANDHWEQYVAAVVPLLLKRWERLSEHLVGKVLLENVWVSPRTVNKGRDRPDQTPGPGDRGSRTPEPDGDYGSLETRVTLETFLQGCAGKGPIPSSFLFVLLEFRQLNFVSRPLSLSDLLFRHYLPLKGGDDEKRTIVDYLISNPEQICWVLDGYDEFHSKLTRQQVQKEVLDPKKPLPVADLISGLLNRQLLPGCTVVVTCRARDVTDLEGVSDKVGQLLGWDCNEIKEYVHNFFAAKGHGTGRALGRQAADLLLSTQHLLAMSSLPALCNICCICLEYLLLEERDGGRGSMTRKKAREKGVQMPGGGRGGGGDKVMDVTNGEAQPPFTPAQILSTHTQVYLTVLGAFLSCDPEKRGRNDTPKNMTTQQSIVYTLSQYQPELCELSQLAWKGLERGKIVFLEEDISQDVLKFSIRTGLFSQVELRREDGTLVNSYSFIHLTVQEFLAALRVMTSQEVSDTQLKKRFSLKTRWMTKSDQRTVFTDSLHLYVCGLASPHCTEALVQLATTSGGTGGSNWVQKRQALVVKLLKNLCNSNTLTGPKVLELCHCVQESQNQQLAQQVVGTRRTLELRNIRVLPSDIDALAFVVNSVGDNGIGLDFGACSMELECLDVLPRCQYIHYLCFRSRKYGDKFAEKLSSILPNFTTLRKFGLNDSCSSVKDLVILTALLPGCPAVRELHISLSNNSLGNKGLKKLLDVLPHLSNIQEIDASNNGIGMEGVVMLAGALCSQNNLTQIHISHGGSEQVTLKFSPDERTNYSNLEPSHVTALCKRLAQCRSHLELDSLTDEAIVNLLKILPKMKSLQRLDVSHSITSTAAAVILVSCLTVSERVTSVVLRPQTEETESFIHFDSVKAEHASCSITHFSWNDVNLERLLEILQQGPRLSHLDLSRNQLEDKGVKRFLDSLPELKISSWVNLSNNSLTQQGLLNAASTLRACGNVSGVEVCMGAEERCLIWFTQHEDCDKTLSISESSLERDHLVRLAEICPSLTKLELKNNSLDSDWIEDFVRLLNSNERGFSVSFEERSITSEEAIDLVCRCLDHNHNIHSIKVHYNTLHLSLLKSTGLTSLSLVNCAVKGYQLEPLMSIIQKCPLLTELDFSHNTLGLDGAEFLCTILPLLPNLTSLSIGSKETCVVEEISEALLQATAVQCLNLAGHVIGDPAVQTMTRMFPRLRSLKLNKVAGAVGQSGANGLLDLLSAMEGLTRIEEIGLEGWRMADRGIEQLIRLLPFWTELRKISLSENLISDQSGDRLLQAMISCSHLEELHVWSNRLGNLTAARMALVLPSLTHITVLNISENCLGPEGSASLSKAIMCMKNLTKILLTSVGTPELCAVAASLAHCPLIQDVGLGWNNCGDDVAVELSGVMPLCQKLNRIDLESNSVSVIGAEALVRALQSCPALQLIRLWRNKVTSSEAQRLLLQDRRLNFSST
ncbi:Protein NLRC5 [Collichthys lucidus]|uniref:Protein NLRC5 n=1 Tax=Collichthys lucidus TaxID=240159 RepID=A0A4U5UEK3_COLLU|nr:Protein NLRC5 [Collichthys lucidus]